MKHVAVVPVVGLDASTRHALRYASTLTPRVVALHVAVADGTPSGLVDAWAEDVPLVLLEGAPGSDAYPLLQAIQVLKGTEHADRATVVLPSAAGTLDVAHVVGPGVVVCPVPPTVMGL